MRRTMFCMIFSLFVGGMMAQPGDNQTTVDVQVRPRAEYRNGALFPRDRGTAGSVHCQSSAPVVGL